MARRRSLGRRRPKDVNDRKILDRRQGKLGHPPFGVLVGEGGGIDFHAPFAPMLLKVRMGAKETPETLRHVDRFGLEGPKGAGGVM